MWIDEEQLSKQQLRKIQYILKGQIMPKIKVKVLNENCMPTKGHRWDAGWDLKAAEAVTVPAGETLKVHTGVIFEVPVRHCGVVVPRSGLGTKHRVTLANDIGIIDAEYRGEILVFLSNDSDKDFEIKQYDRFAQMLIMPINTNDLWPVSEVSKTGRGDGGFGSTGVTTTGRAAEFTTPQKEDVKTFVQQSPDSAVYNVTTDATKEGDVTAEEFSQGDVPETDLTEQAEAVALAIDEKVIAEVIKTAVPEPTEDEIGQLLDNMEKPNKAVDIATSQLPKTTTEKRDDADAARNKAVAELKKMKPADYVKLQKSGKLFELHPIASGDMKTDLGL